MSVKYLFSVFLLAVCLSGCNHEIDTEDLSKINGYWEIEKVIFPNGTEKKYTINETIDYFQLKNTEGFREKVTPQFDGKYISRGLMEKISVLKKDKRLYFQYSTRYGKWTEELISITTDRLVLENNQGIEYHYKKPIPFSIK